MTAHAFLAPSSAHRWVRCALAPTLERAFPSPETEKSREGTAAHWAVEQTIAGVPPALGDVAPNGVAVTEEMLDGAEMLVADVEARLGAEWRGRVQVEKRVQIPRVHPAHNWGTPDLRAWLQVNGRWVLYLWDYKFGHRVVDAFENWQLIDYAAGCFDEMCVNGAQDQTVAVEIVVVQPRVYHREGPVRSWRVAGSDLRPYVNRLRMAAEAATGVNPRATPGAEQCRDCSGRIRCEANQRAVYDEVPRAYDPQPIDLSPNELGRELRTLRQAQALLSARVAGLEEEAMALIRAGKPVAFFALQHGQGRKTWAKPVAEVLTLGTLAGVNFAKPPEPVTPTQAAKLAPQLAPVIELYSERKPGEAKLVEDDGSLARKIFSRTT